MGREATDADVGRPTPIARGGSGTADRILGQTQLRVVRVRAKRFRGISMEMVMDFRTPDGKPVSAIIAGDNGTGKSSVVDALEFALQSRVTGKAALGGDGLSTVSYAGGGQPLVEVLLSDGSASTRRIEKDRTGELIATGYPHPSFSVAPFVLRRRDILRFWDTPAEHRQSAIADYFSHRPVGYGEERDSLKRYERGTYDTERRRLEAKRERLKVAEELAGLLGIVSDAIPSEQADFEDFVMKVYGGKNPKDRELAERRDRIRFDPQVKGLIRKVREANRRLEFLGVGAPIVGGAAPQRRRAQRIAESMLRLSRTITDSFREVSTAGAHVQRIEVHPGRITPSSLEVVVQLQNGQDVDPRNLFSEANLDLLALLILLAVAKESAERGQAKLLVLDDVLQSVDATFRVRAAEYILAEFSDWQLIYTVHDRLWQEQLRMLLRRFGMSFVDREIVRWSFESGPTVLSASLGMEELLQEAMRRGDAYGTCAHAGLLLERTCNALSYNLPISVTRRLGDKYTLGDLWPGILKTLKKTSAAPVAADVDRWLHLRNLLGAHYNEWAQALSRNESWQFGEAVLKLLDSVRCGSCHRWVEVDALGRSGTSWSCRCSSTTISKALQH